MVVKWFLLVAAVALCADGPRLDLQFFITNDCPISNAYAPEIQRICRDYADKGVRCKLIYSDPSLAEDAIRAHQSEYGLSANAAVVDRDHSIAKKAGATITPEAALFKGEQLLYLGRIDDRYIAWGKSRTQAGVRDLRRAIDEVLAGKPVSTPRTKAIGCYIPLTH